MVSIGKTSSLFVIPLDTSGAALGFTAKTKPTLHLDEVFAHLSDFTTTA